MSRKTHSLQATLFRLMVFPILLVIFILAILISVSSFLLLQQIQKDQDRIIHELALESNEYIQNTGQTMRWIAQTLIDLPPEKQAQLLAESRQTYANFTALYLLDPTGKVILEDTDALSLLDLDLSREKFFYQNQPKEQTYFSPPFISPTTGQVAVTAAVPLQRSGQMRGMLVGELNLEQLQAEIDLISPGEQRITFIVDPSGKLVAYPDYRWVQEQRNLGDLPLLANSSAEHTTFQIFNDSRWESRMIGSSMPAQNGWKVVTLQPFQEAARPMLWMIGASLLTVGISLALLIWVEFFGLRKIIQPISLLARNADALSRGQYQKLTSEQMETFTEMVSLGQSFNRMAAAVQERDRFMEQRIADRTNRIKVIALIGEQLNAILNLDHLLAEIVHQIKGNFAYYFVGVFLLDDDNQLVLREASDVAGALMKAQKFSVRLDQEPSLVAQAARNNKLIRAPDIHQTDQYMDCNLLPDTLSEIAIPLLSGEQVIGVLDVQENRLAAFDASEIDMFRSLANQIGIAIHNALLYREMEKLVEARTTELITANRELQVELQERERIEQALRTSQAELNKAQRIAHIGSYSWNLETGEVHWSDEMKSILDFSQEQPLEMLNEMVHPDDIGLLALAILQANQSGEPLNVEYRIIRKDGSIAYLQQQAEIIQDIDGKPLHIIGVIIEITERKLAEAERERLLVQVNEQAQQVREIMNTVPEGVFLLGPAGQIVLANPVAQQGLIVLANAGVGDTISSLGNYPLSELLQTTSQGAWHKIKAGEYVFEAIARPLNADAGGQQWVMVIRDITQEQERQERLQQQERLAAVGQLASGIAHDFNNIMAVVLLYTEIILNMPDLDSKIRERLFTIFQQAHRASDLIQQILDFSRRSVIERRPIDLLPMLKEQVKLLERTLPENIRVHFRYASGDYFVNADPTRLQQAMMNLAVNARDAMPEGGELYIDLSHTTFDEIQCITCGQILEGNWVCITIRDTGTGISSTDLPYIFEPFYTTKAPGKGTGLGLAQVYGITKQHEGHVNVSSTPGQGSIFTLYLPCFATITPGPAENETGTSIPSGQGQTILVVEDESATRQAIVESLQLLNYRVRHVPNGVAALDFLKTNASEIDLVLSDLIMPEMSGTALFHAIQKHGLKLPVILMSGHPMQEEMERLQLQGLVAWIMKPPNLRQLAQVIQQALI